MEERLLTKNFILMFIANTLICIGFYMIMPILPVYAIKDIGIEQDKMGIVIGVFAITSVIGRLISGFLVDKYGRMIIYMPALLIFTMCFGSYVFAVTVMSLLIVRLAHGFAWGLTNTAASTIVSDIIPYNMRGRGIGYFGLSMTAGMAIGPSLGAFMMNHELGLRQVFLLTTILCFIGFICSCFLTPPSVPKNKVKFNFKQLFEMKVLGIAGIEFFFGVVYASVMIYTALHGLELNISNVGTFFLIFALITAATRPAGGRIMERNGPTPLLASGFCAFTIGLLMLAFAKNDIVFLISGAFLGLGGGFIMPTIMTMGINVVLPQRRGAANASIFTAFDIGIGLGAVIFGVISKYFGYLGMYVAAAGIVAIPAIMYFGWVRRTYKEAKDKMAET